MSRSRTSSTSSGSTPGRLARAAVAAAPVEVLRGERDRLRALVDTFPTREADKAQVLECDVECHHRGAGQMRAEAERLRAELEGLGPFARRGWQGQQLQARLALAEGNAATVEEAGRSGQAR